MLVLCESDPNYRTRSLPAWGKGKQRPVSTTDDLEELYAKVHLEQGIVLQASIALITLNLFAGKSE